MSHSRQNLHWVLCLHFERATSEPWRFPQGLHLLQRWWPDAQEHVPSLRKSLVSKSSHDSLLKNLTAFQLWKGGSKHIQNNHLRALVILRLGLWERQRITPNPLISKSLRQRQQCMQRELPVFKETGRLEGRWWQRVKCVCVFWHRTWVSPVTMHRTITTDLSQWEVSSSSTSFSHKTRVVHPQGRVYFESRGCNGPLSPWLDPRNVWVSVGCSGQGVRRESGWLIEPALGGGSGGEVLVHLSAFPILIRAPPISLWQ